MMTQFNDIFIYMHQSPGLNELTHVTLRPDQNGRYLAKDLKCVILNENYCILIQVLLKIVRHSPVDMSAFVLLAHLPLDKMAAFSQTIFLDAFL